MIDTKETFSARVSRLGTYLTRAFKYEKASILFAMYLSEFLRVEIENSLEKLLHEQGLKMVRVDAEGNKDLPLFFSSQNSSNRVFLVHNLEKGFPEAIQFLNFKREDLIEHKVKVIFWVREEELARITLEAPDFFAFRNRVVEFMDAPSEKEFKPALVAFALETEYQSHIEIKRSIELKEKLLSELSTETEISGYLLASLAILYRSIGAYQKSIDYSEKALKIDLAVFGDKHPNVAREYNNLGLAWSNLGDDKKAIEYYSKALEIDMSVFGDKHPEVAIVYNNLGEAWSNLGDDKKAIEYYSKSLEILLEVYGEKHPHVSTIYNNLGEARRNLGDARKAIEYYSKSLAIDLSVFGDKHPNVARDYNNLGAAWSNLGDATKAIEYLTNALEIFKAIYGVNHPSTKTVQENLDSLQSN